MAADRETSIRRAMEVLMSLGSEEAISQGGMRVSQIGERIGREKSQVSRALKVLAEYGLVERAQDALSYRLGWRVYALAQLGGRPRLLEEAAPRLRALAARTQERAHLSVLQGAEVLTLLSESAGRAVEAVGWVGRMTPAYCTSAGRALLLDHDRGQLEARFAGVELRKLAPKTPTDLDTLAALVEEARERGYALCSEEFEAGLVAVGAPVRDASGAIVASFNVSAPTFRVDDPDELAQAVKDGVAELSAALQAEGHGNGAGPVEAVVTRP